MQVRHEHSLNGTAWQTTVARSSASMPHIGIHEARAMRKCCTLCHAEATSAGRWPGGSPGRAGARASGRPHADAQQAAVLLLDAACAGPGALQFGSHAIPCRAIPLNNRCRAVPRGLCDYTKSRRAVGIQALIDEAGSIVQDAQWDGEPVVGTAAHQLVRRWDIM